MLTEALGRREAKVGEDQRLVHLHGLEALLLCLLYTSDAADERSSVDLGGRRIIKKKKNVQQDGESTVEHRG